MCGTMQLLPTTRVSHIRQRLDHTCVPSAHTHTHTHTPAICAHQRVDLLPCPAQRHTWKSGEAALKAWQKASCRPARRGPHAGMPCGWQRTSGSMLRVMGVWLGAGGSAARPAVVDSCLVGGRWCVMLGHGRQCRMGQVVGGGGGRPPAQQPGMHAQGRSCCQMSGRCVQAACRPTHRQADCLTELLKQ